LMYIPAALDGKLSIVREELRNDLRSAVQMLIVLVLCVRGSKPYTCAEGKKLWQDGFLLMYQHVDAIAKIIQRHGGGGEGGDGSDDHHKTFFAGFTGFGLLYETETGPETKNFF
jgi:hypothetical protein